MSIQRHAIELKVDIDGAKTATYIEALESLYQQDKVKQLGMTHLLSINEAIKLLDVTRVSFERNILENRYTGKGVRHLSVTGKNFPQTKLYIDANDLVSYLIEYCKLEYNKLKQVGDKYTFQLLSGEELAKGDKEHLISCFIKGCLKSSNQMQVRFNRSRAIVSRLSNIIESITFAFPGSQRTLRRFIISPTTEDTEFEKYFTHYKNYEKQMI